MALPTTLTNLSWPTDGVGWVGPFISSAGNVYVIGINNTTKKISAWKATDPTTSFTAIDSANSDFTGFNGRAIHAYQVGDTLHVVWNATNTNTSQYAPFNMATDTWTNKIAADSGGTRINFVICCAKRSQGNDVIVFTNQPGVVNMGKTYGRIGAHRIAGGTSTGAATAIGIGLAATTQQTESVDAVSLGSSDRVHLFWSKGAATAGQATLGMHRCVKSTDNLDGTSPATAATTANTGSVSNVALDDVHHIIGQPFLSSANVIGVPTVNSSGIPAIITGSDADSPTWSTTLVAAAAAQGGAFGATTKCFRLGGAPYDGTNKTMAWETTGLGGMFYDKDTGSGWGTDTRFSGIAGTTADAISVNVFTRGANVVLATAYTTDGATFVYDEVVLRVLGTTVTPATVAGTGSVGTVSLATTSTAAPATVAGTGTVPAVTVSISRTASPATVAGTGTVPSVTVQAGFTPTSLGTMLTWLDPSNTGSITSSGGAVSQIGDLTGNGAHGTQSVAGNKPTTGTRTINSLNGLDFDLDDFLNLNITASDRTQTIFFVVQLDNISGPESRVVFDASAVGGRHIQFRCESGGNGGLLTLVKSGVAVLGQYDTPGVPSTGTPYVCMVAMSDTDVIFRINNNAEETDADSTTFTAALTSTIGSGASGWSIDGILGEVWVFDGQLNSTNRNTGMSQLLAKWVPANTTVTPATVAGTGAVPSVSITVPATATPATVAGTGAVPNVTISATATTTPATVAGTGTVRTVTIAASATATPATVAGTGVVPSVTISATATTTPGTVAGTGTVPSVTISATATAAPATVVGTGTVPAVSISTGQVATPATIAGTGTVPAVTVTTAATANPATVAGVGTVPAVTALAAVKPTPTTVAGIGTVNSVTISATATVTVTAVAGTGAVGAVTITATATATPATVAGLGSVPSVTISTGTVTTPATVVGTGVVRTVTISATATVTPATVAGIGTVPSVTALAVAAPSVSTVAGIGTVSAVTAVAVSVSVVTTVAGIGTVPSVTVQTSSASTATPATIVGTGAVGAVTIHATATVTVNTVAGIGAVPSVIVTAVPTLNVNTVAGIGTVQTVVIHATAVVLPSTVAGIGTVPAVSVSTGGNTNVPVSTVAGTGSVKTVTISASAIAAPAVVAGIGTVQPVTINLTAVAVTLTVQGVGTVQPVTIATTSAAILTTVSGLGSVSAVTIAVSGSVLVQTVAGVGTVNFGAILISISVPVQTVAGIGTVQPIFVTTVAPFSGVVLATLLGNGAVSMKFVTDGAVVANVSQPWTRAERITV